MATGSARLRAELTGASAPGNTVTTLFESGEVYSVVDGYVGDDTMPTITVTWRDTEVPASYLSTYTPVVGDVVLLLIQSPKPPIVLGAIIGPSQEA